MTAAETAPLLRVTDLRRLFSIGRDWPWRPPTWLHAVDGVSLELRAGEVLALVGESGCGKSTLAQTLIGLETPTDGQIFFEGRDITHLGNNGLKALRRRVQMVFQDPYESLNPTMTVGEVVAEPLRVHGLARDANERQARVHQALEAAGLKPAQDFVHRYPHELSGGQRQRVVIAGALVLEPAVLLADEPISMLDVSIRAEILNLLADLRQSRGISVLLITHDLATAATIADRVAVMYLGRIVEIGPTTEVLGAPRHPYTQALLSVVPTPNPNHRPARTILPGETPSPVNLPPGCRFRTRCPVAFERCAVEDPDLRLAGPTHQAACLLIQK
jgi:oligopeptide/dipeptide ABC transporter ATP-binding protein